VEVYQIPGVEAGRLAILGRPRPGQLAAAATAWRQAGLDLVVCLLDEAEAAGMGLAGEAELCRAAGLRFLRFPLPDAGVPASREAVSVLVDSLAAELRAGAGVGIHCRMGIGRSALVAACLLLVLGQPIEAAWDLVQRGRGVPVPHTPWQRDWIAGWAAGRRGPAPGA
jgi:hypothetical protein